jgi:Leucine-rich repeat (LRR) protein
MKYYLCLFFLLTTGLAQSQDCHCYTRSEIYELRNVMHNYVSYLPNLHFTPDSVINAQFSCSSDEEPALKKLPDIIYTFPNLNFLSIHYCNLAGEDYSKLSQFQCLQYITLKQSLVKVSENIARVPKLKELTLYSNNLKTIPAAILEHPTLEELDLGDQSSDTFYLPKQVETSHLLKLDLSKCKLYHIPEGFCNLPQLDWLNLQYTKLKTLPKSIKNLKKVRMIELSDTQIEQLPEEFGELDNLITLGLNRTKLKKFPEVLFKLKNIRRIHLIGTDCTKDADEREAIYNRFVELGKKNVDIFW